MENLCIDTKLLPEGSSAFVFGSYLTNTNPRDLDLLIVYDSFLCPADDAFNAHADFVAVLQKTTGIRVHLTLLSVEEENRMQFRQCANAVPIKTRPRRGQSTRRS